ncbi:metal ABC transporter ATP-binding protein [candidate division TA06 bacterium]|nr:metal ABC transporter ATP-binding protein [candidate division TA06 bacterium]
MVEITIQNTPSCGSCCTKLVRVGVKLGNNVVLEDINLHLHCGQLTAIVGPNGAGKSTLLRTILGEVPHAGHVHFLDFGKKRPDKPFIGYVPQRLEFDPSAPLTVADLFGAALLKRPAWMGLSRGQRNVVGEALDTAGAGHLFNRKLGQLSGGELQRVMLALALTPLPDLLLLDEPVSGVDMAGVDAFYEMVSHLRERYHLSIILVTHDLAAVAGFADRMIFLNKKMIAQGSPAQVLGHHLVQQIFGRLKPELKQAVPETPESIPHDCIACELEVKP